MNNLTLNTGQKPKQTEKVFKTFVSAPASPALCQGHMVLLCWVLYCVSSFSFAARASLAPSPQPAWILVISQDPAGISASGSAAPVSPGQVCPPTSCTHPLAPAAGAAQPRSVSAASLAHAPSALAPAAAVPGRAGNEPSPHGASPGSSVSPARGAHLYRVGALPNKEMPAAAQSRCPAERQSPAMMKRRENMG